MIAAVAPEELATVTSPPRIVAASMLVTVTSSVWEAVSPICKVELSDPSNNFVPLNVVSSAILVISSSRAVISASSLARSVLE